MFNHPLIYRQLFFSHPVPICDVAVGVVLLDFSHKGGVNHFIQNWSKSISFSVLTLLLLITPDVWLELFQDCFPTMSLLRRAGCVPHTTTKNSVQGNVLDHTHVLSTHSLTVLPPFNCFIVIVGRFIPLAQKLVFYWSVYFARLSWLKPQPKTETQPSVNCPPFQWCTAAAHVALDGGTHETWFYWDKFKV